MKTKRPKTEDREPATLQGGGIVAAKIRCILMEDPGGPDEILTADNTRDVIREHYEDAAAQILQCWQSRGRDHREKLTKWKGGPCPRDMLTDALLTVWEYPGALGEIGLHYPPLRKRATVEDAAARVKSATDETDFAGQVEAEMNRRLPVIEAHGVIERGLRSAGVILSRAAADVADVSPAAIAAGLTALRRAYEPNPTGYGTASGVAYPSDNFPLWPDCMTGRDWQKLGEPFRSDLVRLRDSLVALNHATGRAAEQHKRILKDKAKRQRMGRMHGRKGGRPPSDRLDTIKKAVARVLDRKKNNPYVSWLKYCELVIAEEGMNIKPPALAKRVRAARQRKTQK
jgi:hypothetical protein